MGRITVNKQTTQFFTQLEIDPQTTEWDSKTKKINGKGASSLNSQLRNIEARIRTTYQEMFLRGPVLSAEQVKSFFRDYGFQHYPIKRFPRVQAITKGYDRQMPFSFDLQTYTLVYNRVADFIKVKHHRSDMYAAEIDGSFVDDFSDYLFTTYKVSNNQVQKIMQVFKHVTKICIKKGLLKKDPFSDYKIKFDPVDPNFLTVDELKLIIQKKFSLRSLETTKDLFVFSCFTGLAFVDAMNLKRENITLAENGDMWIKITRQKTNIPSIIPVMDIAKSIIKKYENQNDSYVLPRSPHQHVNAYLKQIASSCGIKKNMTFHMARHTYATTAMSFGVPIATIAKTMGHANMKMTQHYARVLPEKIIKDINVLNTATQTLQTLYQ